MTYQVRNGPQRFSFEGDLLARASSRRGDPRWTEMSLFRTVTGVYVLEKVGRSVVTHMPGCPEILGTIPRFQVAHPGDDPDEGYHYHDCVPDEYDFTRLLVEEDRHWAMYSSNPADVVEALYRKKDQARHLPRTSIELLEQASQADPRFGQQWLVEHIA